jgi:uncharacterized damage-inducible protein DinB
MLLETIQKMFKHLHWANQRILETLQSIEEGNEEVIRLFSHILFAEKVWIARLQEFDNSQLPIWAEVDLNGCAELVLQNKESFTTILSNLANTDLDKSISYKNSTGKEFKNSIRDILTHLALHGHYHRGQINSRLRSDGKEPVNIDFITFVR